MAVTTWRARSTANTKYRHLLEPGRTHYSCGWPHNPDLDQLDNELPLHPSCSAGQQEEIHGIPPRKEIVPMRLYIAGPMSGYPEYNYPAFKAAEEDLRKTGLDLEIENPVSNSTDTTPDEGRAYEFYLHAGFVQVLRSDGVVVLDGWEKSPGAKREVAITQWLRRPIWTLKDFLREPQVKEMHWHRGVWMNDPELITVQTAIAPASATWLHYGHIV